MKIYDESLYCQECGHEISVAESKFNGYLCDECMFSTDEQTVTYFYGCPKCKRLWIETAVHPGVHVYCVCGAAVSGKQG